MHLYSSIVFDGAFGTVKNGYNKYKKSFLLNEGDIGMANYEKQVEREAAYPIPISLYNCYRTVRQEKRGIAIYILLIAFLMPHCPVTVVQRYRDGVCSLLFHLFFIICHPIELLLKRICLATPRTASLRTYACAGEKLASKIMSFAKVSRGLHLVTLLCSLVEVHSQTTTPFISFQGQTLANHSYVDFNQVGGAVGNSVRCRSELDMCCSRTQGILHGDWFFPNGDVLPFPGNGDPYEGRGAQTVDLHRYTEVSPSGIYRCDIAFDSDEPLAKETFYVGVYNDGGTDEHYFCPFFIFGPLCEKVHYFTLMQVTSPYLMV